MRVTMARLWLATRIAAGSVSLIACDVRGAESTAQVENTAGSTPQAGVPERWR